MKKFLAMALAVAMTLSLAACGGGSGSGSSADVSGSGSSAGSGSQTAGNPDFKVGAIYINGQNDTAGYTYQHHKGITTAMENLGMDPRPSCSSWTRCPRTTPRCPTPLTPWPARAAR